MHHFNIHALPGRFPFLSNAAASSFPTQQQQQLQLRARNVAVSAAAAATIGAAGMHISAKSRPLLKPQQQQRQQPLFLIPKELAEVICGAIGEIIQVAVLYPVDTIKVGSAEQRVAIMYWTVSVLCGAYFVLVCNPFGGVAFLSSHMPLSMAFFDMLHFGLL
jgi:hypothetical protein